MGARRRGMARTLAFVLLSALAICGWGQGARAGPAQREERASTIKGGAAIAFVDNLAPGFSSKLCADREKRAYRGPYLQAGGHDRMIIRFKTEDEGVGVVCFGESAGQMTNVAIDDRLISDGTFGTGKDHLVELKGLRPDTSYSYLVAVVAVNELYAGVAANPMLSIDAIEPSSDGAGVQLATGSGERSVIPAGEYYGFRTFPVPRSAIPSDRTVRVWAFGDSGYGNDRARKVRDAMMKYTGGDWDLSLGLGDLAYGAGKEWEYQQRFFEFFEDQNARVPVFGAPGNHDRYTCDMWNQKGPYFDVFTHPGDGRSGGVPSGHKSYYSFDYGPIHFVSVDSDTLGLEDDDGLYEWLNQDLAVASKANYTWIVAFHHQPPYSKGSHDSDAQYECYKLRSNLVPTFEKYGVDLVLAGHSHSYERSVMLDSHFKSSYEVVERPSVVKQKWQKDADSEGDYDFIEKAECGPNSGTVYIVSGSATQTSGGALNHRAMAVSRNKLGSVLLEFKPDATMHINGIGALHGDGTMDYLDRAVISKATCAR